MAESTENRRAFDLYFRLGPGRSIVRLQDALREKYGRAPSLRTLYGWSSRYGWMTRIAQLEREARAAEDEARIAAIKEMAERQAKAGLFLQQKGMEWLLNMDDQAVTPDAGIRAIIEGAKLERLARGEATESHEVKEEVDARLTELSDDELDAVIKFVHEAVDGKGKASPG